jgi:hypothetical protein
MMTGLGIALSLGLPAAAPAQVFGNFTWQMQPYCNRVSMTLANTPAGFTLDGADDQCGTSRGSVFGVAVFTPTGTVALNFTIVSAPSGQGVHVSGIVDPGTGSGTWRDSNGNSGTFVLGGAAAGLPVRPGPSPGTIAPGSVTTAGLADGAVTSAKIADAAVSNTKIADGAINAQKILNGTIGEAQVDTSQLQVRVGSACAPGQLMVGVNANGTVTCAAPAQAATNLQCTQTVLQSFTIAAGASNFFNNPLCPAGYTEVTPYCYSSDAGVYSQGSGVNSNTSGLASFCAWSNTNGASRTVFGGSTCCRVPAR